MAHAVDTSSLPPHVLREYALLADDERGVLVGPRGDLAWMCFPRWDSPAIFSTLIGGSGVYAIAPTERAVWGGWYEEGNLIWRSRWVTDTGAIVECREALALPADPQHAVVLRRLTALQGSVRAEALLDAACGPPGLLSEEFDVTQRQLRGNLPQAFVHALLLECAVDSRWQAG